MSEDSGRPPNRTVIFRASPLKEMKNAQARPDTPPPTSTGQDRSLFAARDDVPAPPPAANVRNRLMHAAAPLLSLLASVRSGRAQVELPRLHGMVSEAVDAFRDAIRPHYPDEIVKRATYAVCATADDIVLNLPGHENDVAEWAQRSIVVRSFGENIGGDRFWVLLDQMTAQPGSYSDVLELYHACMACGFEGRYRVLAGGRPEHLGKMQRTYQALTHPRELSSTELSPNWRGVLTEIPRVAFWTPLMLAAGAAALVLLLVYVGFRVALDSAAEPARTALDAIDVQPRLNMARSVSAPMPPPPASGQLSRIRGFLAKEIAAHEVEVFEDSAYIRVRSTANFLFDSGEAKLRPEHYDLFNRIAAALDSEPGPVEVQGYTDSDRISSVLYPDNNELSRARAQNVADLMKRGMADSSRVTAKGFGESNALTSNATPQGRARNRRVEVVIQRSGR